MAGETRTLSERAHAEAVSLTRSEGPVAAALRHSEAEELVAALADAGLVTGVDSR